MGQRIYVNLLHVGMGRGPGNEASVVYTLQLYIHMWCIGSGFSSTTDFASMPYIHIFMYVFCTDRYALHIMLCAVCCVCTNPILRSFSRELGPRRSGSDLVYFWRLRVRK